MRRVRLGWILGVSAVFGLCTTVAAQPVVRQQIVVNQAAGLLFTEAKADDVLREAGQLLRTDDDEGEPDDVACEVEFERLGPIRTFTGTTSMILDPVSSRAVLGEEGHAKVVEAISWCDGYAPIGFNFAGCSDGATFAVISGVNPLRLAGVVWAHEIGHTRELVPDGVHPPAPAVMASPIAEGNRYVNESDCRAFQGR